METQKQKKTLTTPSVTASITKGRATATFEPYYWEAYNEIVEPRRFDHYLIRRWLPTLGPTGFALVKALRDRCYHNPATGVLRDTCEIDMDELASAISLGRATLFREFNRNVVLSLFVRRVEQFQMVKGRPQQTKNLYQVCMDDPIHPEDRERYEALRLQKESEREQPMPKKIVKRQVDPMASLNSRSYESQSETHSNPSIPSYESQSETPKMPSHFDTANLQSQSDTAIRSLLPSGNAFTKDSFTSPSGADSPSHKCVPPGEDRHGSAVAGENLDPLVSAWNKALRILATLVNKPTFEAHIRPLRPVERVGDTITLSCPSAFTREWIAKRHEAHLVEALSAALEQPVTIHLVPPLPSESATPRDEGTCR